MYKMKICYSELRNVIPPGPQSDLVSMFQRWQIVTGIYEFLFRIFCMFTIQSFFQTTIQRLFTGGDFLNSIFPIPSGESSVELAGKWEVI